MPFDQQQFQIEVSPVVRVLREARAKIERPADWCVIYLTHPITGAHCIEGAIDAAGFYGGETIREALIAHIPANHPVLSCPRNIILMLFNDHLTTTHADVLALFDRAIAAAEAAS